MSDPLSTMEAEILSQSVDKSQIPPLHQKRILAFINHFIINSCSFLNEFALNCETKFIQLERKIQKVEAALVIVEAKLASIPDSDVKLTTPVPTTSTGTTPAQTTETASTEANATNSDQATEPDVTGAAEAEPAGIRACEDARYRKFFKMMQFGVPAQAVKLKMQAEGVEPSLLDTPNLLLADGITS